MAALLVVFHHCAWKARQYSSDPWGWFSVGECGVDLFFIISGYIMCRATDGKQVRFGAFMKARGLRILPLYWLLTLVALGVFLVAPKWVNTQGGETAIWNSFTLWPSAAKLLINNGWTLSYEFLFYFIFGLGLAMPLAWKTVAPVLVIGALVVLGHWVPPSGTALAFATHPLLLEFAMGIAAYWVLSGVAWTRVGAATAVLSGVAGLVWVNFHGPHGPRPFYYGLPCWLTFVGLVSFEDDFVRRRSSPLQQLMERIGDSSYSLYLVHSFALGVGVIGLRAIGLANFGHLFAASLAVISVGAGLACFRWLESPLSHALRRRAARRGGASPHGGRA